MNTTTTTIVCETNKTRMFFTREEAELALGLTGSATIDAPIVHATYDDTTYNLMDCREYLGPDPVSGTVATQLAYAESYGADGIMVPLSHGTAAMADVIHVGDRGWYFYVFGKEGLWAHVPGEDPIFRSAVTKSTTPLFAIDGTGYAVLVKTALRANFSKDRTTPYVRYSGGIVDLL